MEQEREAPSPESQPLCPTPPGPCLGQNISQSSYCLLGKVYGILLQLFMKGNIWCFCGRWVGEAAFTSLLVWSLVFLAFVLPVQLFQIFSEQQSAHAAVCAAGKVLLWKQPPLHLQFYRISFSVINKRYPQAPSWDLVHVLHVLSSMFFICGSIWRC